MPVPAKFEINSAPPLQIDQSELSAFNRDGAVLLKSVFDSACIAQLRDAADRALGQSEKYFWRQMIWREDKACRDYCINSMASHLAALFLNSPKVNLLYDQVFAKTPGAPQTPWHNDLPYWPVRNGRALTVWLALDPIRLDSGPLEFIAGSHLWDKWFKPFATALDGAQTEYYSGTELAFDPLPDFDSQRGAHQILCWEMDAGDVIVFDGLSVHCAKPNTSSAIRRGYAVRYADHCMTYFSQGEINPFLINADLRNGQSLDSDKFPIAYSSV